METYAFVELNCLFEAFDVDMVAEVVEALDEEEDR